MSSLADRYRAYIACLNARDWARLGEFVHPAVVHNARHLHVDGYRQMLENDVAAIPDLQFNVEMLIVEGNRLASRLRFDCTPRGVFLGLPVNGRRVSFAEHAIYAYEGNMIAEVWSLIDKAAIEAQL